MTEPELSSVTKYSARWWGEYLLRLRLLIALAVAFGLALPAFVIAHLEGVSVKKEAFEQLHADLERLTNVSAEGLRESLWQLYPGLGEPIAEAIFRDPRIHVLRVHDVRNPKPFMLYQRPEAVQDTLITLSRDVMYEKRKVGSVEISMSTAQAELRAQLAQRKILVRTLIGLLFSELLIFIVMHWQLVRPIDYLKRSSARLAEKDLSVPIRLGRRDELGQLARSLERTRIALARAFAELEDHKLNLQEHADALEHRVGVRTHELAESNQRLTEVIDNLSRAQSELIEADRLASLGRMVAGIAHELNTPLGSSLTMTSTLIEHQRGLFSALSDGSLRRSQLDEFTQEFGEGLHILERNIVRAAEMVDKFRQVAVDQTSEQRRHFELLSFVGEVQLTLSPNFKRSPIRLHTDIPADLHLDSFPGPLGQVITNLLLNALLHAFDGRSQGNLWLSAEPLPEARARLSVRDDGLGMSASVREHIFDPFFTTRLGRGGSGLGLAIVYNIVTGILGGRVSVTSTPGLGSEFTIDIPLSAPSQAASAPDTEIAAN